MPARLSRVRVIGASFSLFAAALLCAQSPSARAEWTIPAGGAAVYDADERCEWEPVDASQRRRAKPYAGPPHLTMLFASEVAADRRHVDVVPRDLRWVAPWLAFDLRKPRGGRLDVLVPWLDPFGDLRLRGRVTPPDEDGVQRIECKVTTGVPKQDDRISEKTYEHWLKTLRDYDRGKGTLEIARRTDATRGAVVSFEARLQMTCRRIEDGAEYTLDLRQQWTLRELRENRGGAFQARVHESVRRASKWIHRELAKGTDWDRVRETSRDEGPGAWALAVLALLHAEWDPNDTIVRAYINRVRGADLTQTYTLALAMLMLEKSYAPPNERYLLLSGAIERPSPRQLSPEDLALMKKWTARLLSHRDDGVDPAYLSRWGYYTGRGYDNSNSQFALLALHSAKMCGVDVSRTVWHAAARHLLEAQCPAEGDELRLPLVSHREVEKLGAPHLVQRSSLESVARGHGYSSARSSPYGSMVAAGVSGLTVCLANLIEGGREPSEAEAIEQAIRDGFSWLHRNRAVRVVAGFDRWHQDYWFYYWLYSLERACELSRVAWIGDWDWYFEGAELLMGTQHADGKFDRNNLVNNCFAVLFLKKAQLPVLTGPRDRKQ